jgi:O-antigen/teichoic acid export membrane protein
MLEYNLRLWIGSGIFAFGIFWWTLFLVNAFKIKINKTMLYKKYHPKTHVIMSSLCVILGLWFYPTEETFPLIPLILGITFGFYISRRERYF